MNTQLNPATNEILGQIMKALSGAFSSAPDATPADVVIVLLKEAVTTSDPIFKGMASIILRACIESSLEGMSRAVFMDRMNTAVRNVVVEQQKSPIYQLLTTISQIIKQKDEEETAPAGATLN